MKMCREWVIFLKCIHINFFSIGFCSFRMGGKLVRFPNPLGTFMPVGNQTRGTAQLISSCTSQGGECQGLTWEINKVWQCLLGILSIKINLQNLELLSRRCVKPGTLREIQRYVPRGLCGPKRVLWTLGVTKMFWVFLTNIVLVCSRCSVGMYGWNFLVPVLWEKIQIFNWGNFLWWK